MQLHKAIAQAAKFAAKGKDATLYQSVQLIPKIDDKIPARVFATDGLIGCIIDVDVDLPEGLLPLEAIKAVSKQKVSSVERTKNEITFRLVPGGVYKLIVKDEVGYPSIPEIPSNMVPLEHWKWIRKVMHAAADPKSGKPAFQYVRFRPNCVEATDSFRVAVVNVPGWATDRLGLARLFKGWSGYPRPLATFTEQMAWFKVGSEYRYAPLKLDGSFPDCHKLIPEDHDGPHLTVDTDKLVGAVKRATIVSPLKTVALDFNGGEVVIKSWSAEEGGKAFRAALGGYPSEAPGKALKVISGKLLTEALKQVETPNVRLCYRDLPNDPLRVESGAFVECLWPWKVGEAS